MQVSRVKQTPYFYLMVCHGLAMLLACVIFFPAASVAQTQNYQLGPGDVLTVIVLRHPEMSAEQVTVTSNGGIYVPVAGRVQVTGKTVEQVANQITTLLRVRLVRPEVTVTLREARPRQVFVLGAVAKPGVYAFQPGWRVSEVLAISGGLIARPELTEAILSRANRNPIPLNLAAILTNSNQPENVALQPGDTVRFTVRSLSITVTGQVIKSGTYDVPPGTGVVEALAIAGGAAPKAALSKVTVKHLDGSVVPVDLYKVMVLGQQAGDLALQAGDMVTVPESQARISVIGAVQKAGYYDIPDGTTMRVADALTAAGGPTPQASLTRASIRHADGSAEPVDLYKILVRGDGAGNVQLAPGDIVSVPESKGVTVLGAVTKPGTLNVEQGASPHLADILAQAGGLNIKPEAAHITITRTIANGQSKTVDVDPVALLEQRDPRQNESVQEGDLITVSTAKSNVVFISGEVKTPGMYELKEGDSVPELIARAGGPTPQASLAHINVVERDGTTQIVNALMNNGQKPNLPLQEGDYVVVPKNTARVLVMNAVNQPGYVAIPENGKLTLGEALIATGGPKDRAKLHQVAVMRQSPTGIDQRVVSLDKVYNGQMAVNITLQDGDVVYVPQGNQSGSSLSAITSVLGTLGIFGSLFRHN